MLNSNTPHKALSRLERKRPFHSPLSNCRDMYLCYINSLLCNSDSLFFAACSPQRISSSILCSAERSE